MRLTVFVLFAVISVTVSGFAQPPPPPVPQPAPRKPLPPVQPEDIKGEVTNPILSIKLDQAVAAHDFLVIEFEYKTDTPGKTAVAVEAIIDGKAVRESFGYQPTILSEKAGKGKVKLNYHGGGDEIADEIKLYLWPSSGAPGRRDVATLKGPVRFVGLGNKARLAPLIMIAQVGGKEGDQIIFMARRSWKEQVKEDGKVVEKLFAEIYPTAKLFGKDVRAYGVDGKPLEKTEMAKRLAKPALVVVFYADPPDPAQLQLLKEGTVVLVVPPDTFDSPPRPTATMPPPPPK